MRMKALILTLFLLYCYTSLISQKITGITVVAPPQPIGESAIDRVAKTKANWVCLVPYGFHKKDNPEIRHNIDWQWWGEKVEGVEECIRLAKEEGMNVMLKPQIYVPGSWVGDVDFQSEEDWQTWEAGYKDFIMTYLDLAVKYDLKLFCIGTEYKIAIQKREQFWRDLIKEARQKYNGQLVYSSNWDAYAEVPFWDALDYIGISAYFPLNDDATPRIKDLVKNWKPVKKDLKQMSKKLDKKILFTEYGYLTIDQAAHKAWLLEKKVKSSKINQDAQANAFAALYQSMVKEDWWAGGFIWKWFPDGMGHEGYVERDYTPQDKKAEHVIKVFYEYMNSMPYDR